MSSKTANPFVMKIVMGWLFFIFIIVSYYQKLVKLPFFVTKNTLSEADYYLTPMFTCNLYL